MKITIHKIIKYKNYWKVTFTSERNENGITINTPVFDDVNDLFLHIEKYIENNLPEEKVEEVIEKDTSEIQISTEPIAQSTEEVNEPTEEELQLQEMQKELAELQNQKNNLANQIKTLLEDWKLDLDLIKLKEGFGIDDEQYLQILEDKENRKVAKYVELKTQYEDLKKQIEEKQLEIQQFAEENNLSTVL